MVRGSGPGVLVGFALGAAAFALAGPVCGVGVRHKITVVNATATTLQRVVVSSSGTSCSLGDLRPWAIDHCTISPERDDNARLHGVEADGGWTVDIDTYVSPGLSGSTTVVVLPGREVRVDSR